MNRHDQERQLLYIKTTEHNSGLLVRLAHAMLAVQISILVVLTCAVLLLAFKG